VPRCETRDFREFWIQAVVFFVQSVQVAAGNKKEWTAPWPAIVISFGLEMRGMNESS
jgi:hypothetical protein